jgi:hypothetical protein
MAPKKAPATPPVTRPPDGPNEIDQVIGRALAAAQGTPSAKEDPPVATSGYWDYDESTAKKYWVNYQGTKPLSKATLEFYELDRDELKRFQELAFQAGYYGSGAEREDIPFGAYDPDTYKIWSQYADRAADTFKVGKRLTIWDLLQDDVNNRPESAGKSKEKKRAPLITQLPDPREIEEMVRGVAPSVIGRDADPAFTQDFIAMYTRIVSNFQEQKYALENTEEGGSITAPPSAEALASFRLRTEQPEQYEEKRSAARQAAYTALLKGAL